MQALQGVTGSHKRGESFWNCPRERADMRAVHAGLSVPSREGRNHWALCTRGLLVHVVREEAASERICTAHQMWPCSQAKGWGRGA